MRVIKNILLFVLASVSEVFVALGASLLASGWLLPQTNFKITRSHALRGNAVRPRCLCKNTARHAVTVFPRGAWEQEK